LIKNSQPFGKKFQKTVGGIFFDSHCSFEFKKISRENSPKIFAAGWQKSTDLLQGIIQKFQKMQN